MGLVAPEKRWGENKETGKREKNKEKKIGKKMAKKDIWKFNKQKWLVTLNLHYRAALVMNLTPKAIKGTWTPGIIFSATQSLLITKNNNKYRINNPQIHE